MSRERRLVHDLAEARAAVAEGAVLVGEAGLAGIGWWREMLRLLRAEFPQVPFTAVLDCGPAPGLALAALRAGIDHIAVEAPVEVMAKLVAIAERMGARVERR